jgi:hypothetical protein
MIVAIDHQKPLPYKIKLDKDKATGLWYKREEFRLDLERQYGTR